VQAIRAARLWALLAPLAAVPCFGQTIPVTDFGAVQVNSASLSQPIQFTFPGGLSEQPAFGVQFGKDFQVVSSSCNAGLNACTVNTLFSPQFAGLRQDAVVAKGVNGAPVARMLLRGTGLAPQAALVPGVFSNFFVNDGTEHTLALDPLGNIYTAGAFDDIVIKIDPNTGTATTVAGVANTPGYSGDNGPATSAHLNGPNGVALDGAGNLYILDTSNFVVRRVDAVTHVITTVAGNGTDGYTGDGGPATSAELESAFAITVDLAGDIFIGHGFVVREVNAATGIISTVAGNGRQGSSGDGGAATSAELFLPAGLAVDASGDLYIADVTASVIRKVNGSTGIISTIAGLGFGHPGFSGDGGPAVSAALNGPEGLALDSNGNLYISDSNNGAVRKIDATLQTISTVAGNGMFFQLNPPDGTPANAYGLPGANAVAVDPTGTLYVETNNNIEKVNSGASRLIFLQSPASYPSQNVAVVNFGTQPLTLSRIAASGAAVSQNAASNPCAVSAAVPVNAACNLAIGFEPTSPQSQGVLTLTDNSGNQSSQQAVTVSGPYVGAAPFPSSVDFGTVFLHATGTANLTIVNSGDLNLSISSITLSGPDAQDFTLSYLNCGQIPSQQNCLVYLSFTPSLPGQKSATLTITDNAVNSPQMVPLTGLAALPPQLTSTPSPVIFAPQAVGSTSASQIITLTNTGGGPTTLFSMTPQGASFAISTYGCQINQVLQPGDSCLLALVFQPTTGGVVTDRLVIVGEPNFQVLANVPLTGIGLAQFTDVPGSLEHISVGGQGAVWGVNAEDEIFYYNRPNSYTGSSGGWSWVPGWLTQIDAASPSVVWGLNGGGEIYRWDQTTNGWNEIPGSLAQLSIGSDGDVWGLNSAQEIYHYDAAAQSWDQIAGELAQISVGFDGVVWGLNSTGTPYRYNVAHHWFEQAPGTFTSISVGGDGDVWAQNAASLFHFNRRFQEWEAVAAGPTSLSVGGNGNVWGLDASGSIFEFSPATESWVNIPGSLTQIAAAQDGSTWGINTSGQVFEYGSPYQATSSFHAMPVPLTSISAAADGSAWGLDIQGLIYTFDPLTQNWVNVPGVLAQIAVAPNGVVWGVNQNQQIFRYNTAAHGWDTIPGALVNVALGQNGDVWGLNAQNEIFHYDSSQQSWDWIPGELVQISVGVDDAVWGINAGGQIYRFNASTRGWTNVPGSLQQISVGSSNNVWGVNSYNQLYHYNVARSSWDSIQGLYNSVAAGFDGRVIVLSENLDPLQYNPATQSLDIIGTSIPQISVPCSSAIWGIDYTGVAYRYW
jgi:hypothetical protein